MPKSENEDNTGESSRPRTGSLTTIISISTILILIKKAGTTINKTTTTTDALTTKRIILKTSTTKTTNHTISTTKTTILTTSNNSQRTTMNGTVFCKGKKPKFNKWKQNATTVAGGNGYGQKLDQLYHPHGIFIDEKKNIFIADRWNHRISEWKYSTKEGKIIAGGNGQGNRMDQLDSPTDMIVDQQNNSIIIADLGNRRVVQWVNQTQQILIKNISCYGLAIDKSGFLYVSDWWKNEVRRWKTGEYDNGGIIVAGGNGIGHQLNQLNSSGYIFIDKDQSVYVSDRNNHRVMKWRKDAKEGTIVAGGNGQGTNLSQLSRPYGVIVDDLGQIYVADWFNDRVVRWREGKEEGEIVVGGNDGENQPNQLKGPNGLSFDDEENLYVADLLNQRIAKFEIIF
ncbi:unnamed protein product [Adineta steineri]|uniref:Uncharacterized protein n=1 Tax=Adineta steineri TaxID=433720 RepID=A0A814IL34_9BILA|nr:unnamed protein product [Adineta steineri]CAF1024159.1 unnamed protein product [Adineta steineri]